MSRREEIIFYIFEMELLQIRISICPTQGVIFFTLVVKIEGERKRITSNIGTRGHQAEAIFLSLIKGSGALVIGSENSLDRI